MSLQTAFVPVARQLMLVEDNPTLANVLARVLSDAGYEVTTLADGAEALRSFEASPNDWHVVVSDVTMPELSGDRLARALREIRPDLPVILMSGNANLVTPRRLSALGIAAVLEKPVSIDSLVAAVDSVFERARWQA